MSTRHRQLGALGVACALALAAWASPCRAQDEDADGGDGEASGAETTAGETNLSEGGDESLEAVADDLTEGEVMRYPPSSTRSSLILGGIAVTGISYGLMAMSAGLWPEIPGSDFYYVPVVGPFIGMALNDCSPDTPDCGAILYIRYVLLAVSGIAQGGGLGLIGEGVFMTTEADDVSLTVLPDASGDRIGITAFGTF